MAGISTTTGIVSGIDYGAIVEELTKLDMQPLETLMTKNETLGQKRDALTSLQSLFSRMAYMVESLNRPTPYTTTAVTSSNDAVMTATRSGNAGNVGSYTFTAVQLAQSQQTIASGLKAADVALGAVGDIVVSNGGNMTSGLDFNLSDLNGGDGVPAGYIRVTDAAGNKATIDLRNARTINDVIDTINATTAIDIEARLEDDHIVLTDLGSGGSGMLTVQDVGGGTTAKALGLVTRTDDAQRTYLNPTQTDDATITGGRLLYVGLNTKLDFLNDGNGVATEKGTGMFDLIVKFDDGSAEGIVKTIKLSTLQTRMVASIDENGEEVMVPIQESVPPETLGDVINAINWSDTGLGAGLDASTGQLVLFSMTPDPNDETGMRALPFSVVNASNLTPVLQGLGFRAGSATGVEDADGKQFAYGQRLIGSFTSGLTASLQGGRAFENSQAQQIFNQGVNVKINIGDCAGKTATIEITAEEYYGEMQTIEGAIDLFNRKIAELGEAAPQLTVQMNAAKTGFEVIDAAGGVYSTTFSDATGYTVKEPEMFWFAPDGTEYGTKPDYADVAADMTQEEYDAWTPAGKLIWADKNGNAVSSKPAKPALMTDAEYADWKPETKEIWTAPDGTLYAAKPAWADVDTLMTEEEWDNWESAEMDVWDDGNGGVTSFKPPKPDDMTDEEYAAWVETPQLRDVALTLNAGVAAMFGFSGANSFGNYNKITGADAGFQTVSYSTRLADLGGGIAIPEGGAVFLINDGRVAPNGNALAVSVSLDKTVQTVGDVIQAINGSLANGNSHVRARLNDTGDGIMLESTAGTGFTVYDYGTGITTALKIDGTAQNLGTAENPAYAINGSFDHRIAILAKDTLEDIVKKINDANADVTASIIKDGTSAPFRLVITGKNTGEAAAFTIDLGVLGMTTENMAEAKDAVVQYGDPKSGKALTMTSATNTFTALAPGVSITLKSVSDQPVTVNSTLSSSSIKASLNQFVEMYNQFWETLQTYTEYDDDNNPNLLTYDRVARQMRSIQDFIGKSFYNLTEGNKVTNLAQLGITFDRQEFTTDEENKISEFRSGYLTFDEDVFDKLYESDPNAIKEFLYKQETTFDVQRGKDVSKTVGFTGLFKKLVDPIVTGTTQTQAAEQIATYQRQIDNNNAQIERKSAMILRKRQRLLNQFYASEQLMAKYQSQADYVDKIAASLIPSG